MLSDGECKSTYGNGLTRATDRIWYNTYTVPGNEKRDVRLSFFPKDVTFDELTEYYATHCSWIKDKAASAPDEIKRDMVKIFAGYVCPEYAFIHIFAGYACENAYGTVRQKAADAKKREDAWKKHTLRGIDIDKKFAPIKTPKGDDAADMERFERDVDALFGGSVYDTFVPDEYEEIEGA